MRPASRPLVERVWFGTDAGARAARAALAPASLLFRAGTLMRNALFDAGLARTHPLPLPAVSVGNLIVGGTGKTPVAAWLAGLLQERGARPAIVLRGYGADEPDVHRRLNPSVAVVVNPDRVAGATDALAAGADVVVLDDAFQHRRAQRDADVVLVSADRWPPLVRPLPAGPFRESLGALRRASMVLVTRKAATAADADRVERAVRAAAPDIPCGRVHLAPAALVCATHGEIQPLEALAGTRVLAICGVGDPRAFAAQLTRAGAQVTLRAFPDHHAFDRDEIAALVDEAHRVAGDDGLVACTLKDAVKLADRWPAAAPALWYISQQVILEAGKDALDELLDSVLRARTPAAPASG